MVADIHKERKDFFCTVRREDYVIKDANGELRYSNALKRLEDIM